MYVCMHSLKRYMAELKDNSASARGTPEEAREAKLAYISNLELKSKGNANLLAKILFTEAERDFFTAAILRYSDMGWPMEYRQVHAMLQCALARTKRTDVMENPLSVSLSYVRDFIKGRPEL